MITPRLPAARLLQLIACIVSLGVLPARGGAEETTPWLKSLPQAQKIARETGKPIFVVFRCER